MFNIIIILQCIFPVKHELEKFRLDIQYPCDFYGLEFIALYMYKLFWMDIL